MPRYSKYYQDIWVNGEVIHSGARECSKRYEAIRGFVSKFNRRISVLDIGCNCAYFITRLEKEFGSICIGIEKDVEVALDVISKNNTKPILLHNEFNVQSLSDLGAAESFDVVLCLSTIHWLGGSFEENMKCLMSLGDYLVIDLPTEDVSAGGMKKDIDDFTEKNKDKIVMWGESHVDESRKRPMFIIDCRHLNNKKIRTKRIGFTGESDYSLHSDFDVKSISLPRKNETRDFLPGINLWTFIKCGGVIPSVDTIVNMVRKENICCGNDVRPWNIILTGRSIHMIDLFDPGHYWCLEDIAASKNLIIDTLKSGNMFKEFEYVEPVIGIPHLPSLDEIIKEHLIRVEKKQGDSE